jgi:ATP-binding cassette subfamily C protein LapB
MKQKLALVRSMLHNPPVLLLDEPTSAMDFSTEAYVTARLNVFTHHKTVLLATHRTSLLQLVNRAIVIDGGRVVADGPRDTIMQALQSGRIARAT